MNKYIQNILFVILLINMPLQAAINNGVAKIDAYSKKDFLSEFGESYVKGNIAKVVHFTSAMGSFYLVMSIDTTPFNHPYRKFSDAPNNNSIYAYGFVEDHGGLKQIWQFKDFNTLLYEPSFYIKESGIIDADNNGKPEFIVAYFGASDGLDEKPLRIITYHNSKKHKATAYYPAGNAEDKYHIEYEPNWKRLPKPTQNFVIKLFNTLKLQMDALDDQYEHTTVK